jgi:hypothetical protein
VDIICTGIIDERTEEERQLAEREYELWVSGLKYCCKDFKEAQIDGIVYYENNKWIIVFESGSQTLHYCPWCGKKLSDL